MHQGNWTCSECGGAITELPFEPRSNSGLTCRNCYFKKKDGQAGAPAPADAAPPDVPPDIPFDADIAAEPQADDGLSTVAPAGEKKVFTGDWQCATCSSPITELPFEPRNTSGLKCRDCFMKERAG